MLHMRNVVHFQKHTYLDDYKSKFFWYVSRKHPCVYGFNCTLLVVENEHPNWTT